MKARSRKEFVGIWTGHVKQLSALVPSLPEANWKWLKGMQEDLLKLVEVAADNCFPEEKELDVTEDLPKHEEDKRDYGVERGET